MTTKRILVYYPPNRRSIAIETLCIALHEKGHEVFVLTLTPKGPFHEILEKQGITTFSHVLVRKQSLKYFLSHARYLTRFCKKNKIGIVWSHLQEGNIIAVLAQPFLGAKLVTFRHHAESAFYAEYGKQFGMYRNKKEVFLDRVINRFAKQIIVPSSGVWYGMEKYEGCNMRKVRLIPYIYDFSSYNKPDPAKVNALREKYDCQLLLIMVSRLIPSKQHKPVFEVVEKLVRENLSVKMVVMDDGDLREELQKFITDHSLSDHIFLVGFQEDFISYMAAADMLIHPSVTEASNNVVKEMGLLEKAVAVCRHVGDFSDYIESEKNGYFLENDRLKESIETAIRDGYNHPQKLKQFGKALRGDVISRFSDSVENKARLLELVQ